jgi:hypothetical protein
MKKLSIKAIKKEMDQLGTDALYRKLTYGDNDMGAQRIENKRADLKKLLDDALSLKLQK